MNNKLLSLGVFVGVSAAFIGGVVLVGGCGSSGPDPQLQAKNVELAKSMRSYYDKAHGDYAQLSEEDKAAFVKLAGSEDKAKQDCDMMKNGPSRPSSTEGR